MPDGTVPERLALDELERAYRRPSERVVALETVWQGVNRDPRRHHEALARFVRATIERRQVGWAPSIEATARRSAADFRRDR